MNTIPLTPGIPASLGNDRVFKINTDASAAKDRLCRGEVESVADDLEQQKREALAGQVPTPGLKQIDADLEQVRAKQLELEAKRQAELDILEQYHALVERREYLKRELSVADAKFNAFPTPQVRVDMISSEWASPYGTAEDVANRYLALLVSERVHSEFPKWRNAKVSEIEAARTAADEFATIHKIPSIPKQAGGGESGQVVESFRFFDVTTREVSVAN